MAKIVIVCSDCGSSDVRREAWAEWDVEDQEWVLGQVFDQGFCGACVGDASLQEIELSGESCKGCGRDEVVCSADPCEAVKADRVS